MINIEGDNLFFNLDKKRNVQNNHSHRIVFNVLPCVDKISRGFNFADDENFQFRVDLISRLRPS